MFVPVILAALLGSAQATGQPVAPPQPAAPAVQTTADKPWPPEGVTRTGKGIVAPRVIKEVKPGVPPSSKREAREAIVALEAVVQIDGTVGEVRVKPSPNRDSAFEEAAVNAVKKWRFAPGTKDGVPVPVLVEIELSFAWR